MTRRLPGSLALVLIVVAAGCKNPATDAAKTAQSWGASAELVGDQWIARQVPTRYSRRAIEAAHANLIQQRDALRADPRTVPNAPALAEGIDALARDVAVLLAAIERDDRPTAHDVTQRLRVHTRALSPWNGAGGNDS